MNTLTGKIARLPKAIREKLNRRLDDNQPASEILPWLNALPTVQRLLAAWFHGVPISEQNLSHWRSTGYQRWLEKQEPLEELKFLSEDAGDFSRAAHHRLTRGAAALAAGRLLRHLNNCDPADLVKATHAITALCHADFGHVRLRHDQARVRLRDQQLTLSWDKHMRDSATIALRVLGDAQAKAIHAQPLSNQEKIELLGRRLYPKHWHGRHLPQPTKS